ncbi:uncharacterized protein LOC126884768 [Diabrotica virgifera virgifera]|uniref:Ig-like domain-containing protein n=1 Tax=Diabrotica virgifera virgifera TaxID=50390 RepID=A0ABM5K9S8_DIAVI|nr:uncharacterized protein LOC126884768 [Diabrotica virgifera virgifera]
MIFDGIRFFAGIFVVCCLFRDCICLKEVKIDVPQAVLKGHEVILQCLFDLEGDKLYSLKWYHNSSEFYRYTLTGEHHAKPFKLKGFHVVPERSNATRVVLKHATRAINGGYSCEVTADQPSFFTDMKTADLEVVDPPVSDPLITGTKSRYKLGDYVKATCSSEKSDPAVNITWYVNGRPMDGPHVRKYRKTIEGNYISSYSTVQFRVSEQLLDEDKLKLRCSANIYNVWHRSHEKSIELKRSKHDEDEFAPAYVPTITSTEFAHEKFWLYIARDNPEATEWSSPNNNSSTSTTRLNHAIIFVTVVVYMR